MSNNLLLKRNNTSGVEPNLNSLILGELAINTADGKLFLRSELNSISSVKTFLNSEYDYLVLNESLSAAKPQFGGNTVSQVFATVLGGYNNDISGAASTVINGEDNDIASDFSIIGSGYNNKILIYANHGAILGGQNNNLNHQESFIIGSNITSHLSGFTYVNNLSVVGKIYGDGSEISGIGSSGGVDTEVRSLTANWEGTYTIVQTYSGSWEAPDIIDLTFKTAYATYYHELQYDSVTSNLSAVQIYEDNTKTTHLFEKLLTYTSTALLTGISITDKINNNTLTKTLSYDGSDNLISTTRIYT
jgi:hypothetical protein